MGNVGREMKLGKALRLLSWLCFISAIAAFYAWGCARSINPGDSSAGLPGEPLNPLLAWPT